MKMPMNSFCGDDEPAISSDSCVAVTALAADLIRRDVPRRAQQAALLHFEEALLAHHGLDGRILRSLALPREAQLVLVELGLQQCLDKRPLCHADSCPLLPAPAKLTP